MGKEIKNPPPRWASDTLSCYIENCRDNQWATFANKRLAMNDLSEIDRLFRKLLEDAKNPRPLLPAGFLFRSHSAYLAACAVVMAGQLNEAWALLRISLEYGGYAYYIGTDDQRWERWMARHDIRSRSQKDAWRREFTHGQVQRAITEKDLHLSEAYQRLYDQCIDYGAHPNERGVSLGTELEDTEDGGCRFKTVYLHGDGFQLDFALRTTAQVGICVLRIAQIIYPHRSQVTGVTFQLDALSRRF